jgi:fatty acid desaturase
MRAEDLLNDPRDLPFIPLIAQCSALAAAGIGFYFIDSPLRWWLAPIYIGVLLFGLIDRYTLMLHNTSHRPLFRPSWRVLNLIIPVLLGPFFGQTPGTYLSHHLGMHHREDNGFEDLSTTQPYQRDRLVHWLEYYGRFMTMTAIQLPIYHWRAGRTRMALQTFAGELAFYALVVGLWFVDWQATLLIFVGPFLVIRTLMMAGNWAQHAFIAQEAPADPFRNSTTCIECRYNRRCFNDGYHIEHHIRPRLHWSEHPQVFEQKIAEYGASDAIVFRGLDFFIIFVFLMIGRFDLLARAFVILPGAPQRSQEEIIAFLRSRLRPIGQPRA